MKYVVIANSLIRIARGYVKPSTRPATQPPATATQAWFATAAQRWGVIGFTFATFFLLLGTRALNEPDEGRYSEVAREMVESGNWLVPHLWYLPHLDKPPMTYWCEAVSLKLFGLNAWAVRLPLALAAISGLWATFLLARSMVNARAAWISLVLLQTSFLYFMMARFLTTDIFLTQFVAWAVYFFWQSWREVKKPAVRLVNFYAWHLPGWVMTGLAFLVKGPIALAIPVVGLVSLMVFRRKQLTNRLTLLAGMGVGLLVMLGLILPWFLAVFHREPDAAIYMTLEQAFGHLFGGTIENRRGNPFYFFGIIAVGLLPWTALLGWLWRRAHWRSLNETAQEAWLLLNVWAIFTFTVFSLSHAKLPAYILPIFPALAILLAWRFFPETPNAETTGPAWWRSCLVSAFALPVFFPLILRVAFHDTVNVWLLSQAVLGAGIAFTVFRFSKFWTFSRQIGVTALAAWAGMMLILAEVPEYQTTYRANQTIKPLGEALKERYQPGTTVVCWGKLPQGLPFYAAPAISAANPPYFGHMDWQEVPFEFPGNRERVGSLLLMNDRALLKVLQAHPHVLLVVNGEMMRDFQQEHATPDMRLIMQCGQWKLFENSHDL